MSNPDEFRLAEHAPDVLRVGDRVRLSAAGKDRRLDKPDRIGTVVGWSRNMGFVKLRWDGVASVYTYSPWFIERAPD